MKYNSIEPFIPSGKDFEKSKKLFLALGFDIKWENGGYAGFQKDGCKFILQDYDDKHFAENLMIRITVSDLDEFWQEISKKNLEIEFNIKLKEPTTFPYGREVNLIDIAGVCWHIAQGD
ncbi:MAG: hypothetical protein EAZ08_13330 [Cytophagales bacterium]|nr:MAG: hypothetical protein EAZ08_13330 [Cytophagales bacterium]